MASNLAADSVIVADAVTKALRAGEIVVPVLRGVSLAIARGEFVAIVGPSGCGKTTLLSLLAALDRPDGGDLRVDGVELGALEGASLDRYRRETIGIVLQFFNLLPSLTAIENVETSLEFAPGTRAKTVRARRAHAMDYLERVGLAEHATKFPAQMSGGMQQRVAIARALAKEPKVLLADEPTGNLDQDSGARVFECIQALKRETGVTCVMVTHDPGLAARTERIVSLLDGRVA